MIGLCKGMPLRLELIVGFVTEYGSVQLCKEKINIFFKLSTDTSLNRATKSVMSTKLLGEKLFSRVVIMNCETQSEG